MVDKTKDNCKLTEKELELIRLMRYNPQFKADVTELMQKKRNHAQRFTEFTEYTPAIADRQGDNSPR